MYRLLLLLCLLALPGRAAEHWLANISSSDEVQVARLPAGAWDLPTDDITHWRANVQGIRAIVAKPDAVLVYGALTPFSILPIKLTAAEPADDIPPATEPLPFLAFTQRDDGTWHAAASEHESVTIHDHNGSGAPDLLGDRWLIKLRDTDLLGFRFYTPDTDPMQQGRAIHISIDGGKLGPDAPANAANGAIDDAEWQRPQWRFLDRNGDGRFFHGTLLAGGELRHDLWARAPDGSPHGRLWPETIIASDLDKDGDLDMVLGSSGYIGLDIDDTNPGFRIAFGPGRGEGLPSGVYPAEDAWTLSLLSGDYSAAAEHLWHVFGYSFTHLRGWPGTLIFGTESELRYRTDTQLRPTILRDPWGPVQTVHTPFLPGTWDGSAIGFKPPTLLAEATFDRASLESPGGQKPAFTGTLAGGGYAGEPRLYHDPLLGTWLPRGATSGRLTGEAWAAPIHLYDDDADGYIDHYVYGDRSLRYDRDRQQATFRQGTRAVTYPLAAEFPELPWRVGEPLPPWLPEPTILTLQFNQRGKLAGYPTRPAKVTVSPFYVDSWHADGQPFAGHAVEIPGLTRLALLRTPIDTPLAETELAPNSVLLISHFRRGPSEAEIAKLRDWIAFGGSLLLMPAEVSPDQRVAMNALLEALEIDSRFAGPLPADLPALIDPTDRLLPAAATLPSEGWTISASKQPLLLAGDTIVASRTASGHGQVYLIGLPLFTMQASESDETADPLTERLLRLIAEGLRR